MSRNYDKYVLTHLADARRRLDRIEGVLISFAVGFLVGILAACAVVSFLP